MARVSLPDVTVTLADQALASSTTIASAGGYVVAVATALPDQPLTLTSVYLAEPAGDIAASHLLIAPGARAAPHQRVLGGPQAGETHARLCLLDHAAELQATLAQRADGPVIIDVGPRALHDADTAWSPL